MTTHTYPLLLWRMSEDLVCGHVVGAGLEVARADARKVQASLAAEMQREDRILRAPVTDFHLRRVALSFRPSYRGAEGQLFPTHDPLTVPLDAVHGANDFGCHTCFLPRLDLEFHYYDPSNLDTLMMHFARDAIRDWSPERLVRYLLAPAPWLDEVAVRERAHRRPRGPEKVDTPRLSRVADRLPLPRRRGREGAPEAAWERGSEVHEIEALLGEVNLLLVGEHGVGKSAVLREAVRRRAKRSSGPTFWATSAHRLVSGARYLGDWQQLCDEALRDLVRVQGVLCVQDVVDLLRVGGDGPEDSVAAYLVPALDSGDLHLVGEITPRALEAARGLLPGFLERFRLIRLPPPSDAQVRAIMVHLGSWLEDHQGVALPPAARRLAHRLLERTLRAERFPGKAVRFLAEAAQETLQRPEGGAVIDEAAVMGALVRRTGLPALLVDDRRCLDVAAVRGWFSERIVGQPVAVDAVTSVIRTFKAGLNDPDKPIATLLFSGPTGVGKTAMAGALADWLFGEGREVRPLIRVDMSELQHPAQMARWIGTPSGEPGELVRQVRATPFSVVLLDEIEKASPVFFDALLGVLDEGILADGIGRETDFRSCVLILTTNLGARRAAPPGFGADPTQDVASDIRAFFRPEFFNRLDRVVPFGALKRADVLRIARLELGRLGEREGPRARGLCLEPTEALVAWVADRGFDATYGARALQRVVEHHVVAALSRHLLRHPGLQGATCTLDVRGGEVVVR